MATPLASFSVLTDEKYKSIVVTPFEYIYDYQIEEDDLKRYIATHFSSNTSQPKLLLYNKTLIYITLYIYIYIYTHTHTNTKIINEAIKCEFEIKYMHVLLRITLFK